jgi:hypothetical protein
VMPCYLIQKLFVASRVVFGLRLTANSWICAPSPSASIRILSARQSNVSHCSNVSTRDLFS